MKIQTFQTSQAIDAIQDALKIDGAVIVDGIMTASEMMDVDREINPYFQQTPLGEGYFWGRRTKRMGGLFVKSPTFRKLALNETVLSVVNSSLKPYCDRIQINLTQAIQIEPGEPEQVMHRDSEVFPFQQGGMELMINVLLALDDFTTENGATCVALGTHREKEICREPDPSTVTQAVMPRGSALIYLGSVVHGGGANRSRLPRRALVASYSLGWLKQAENQYLANPPHIAATFPEKLQRLVGYQIHTPNLGWYEGQDPMVVLEGRDQPTMAARDFLPEESEALLKERYDALVA